MIHNVFCCVCNELVINHSVSLRLRAHLPCIETMLATRQSIQTPFYNIEFYVQGSEHNVIVRSYEEMQRFLELLDQKLGVTEVEVSCFETVKTVY